MLIFFRGNKTHIYILCHSSTILQTAFWIAFSVPACQTRIILLFRRTWCTQVVRTSCPHCLSWVLSVFVSVMMWCHVLHFRMPFFQQLGGKKTTFSLSFYIDSMSQVCYSSSVQISITSHHWLRLKLSTQHVTSHYGYWLTFHYNDVIMGTMASQITSLAIVCSTGYSGTDQRKHQSSASLAFVRGIHRGPVNSPHRRPVMRKMFPFDDVIMCNNITSDSPTCRKIINVFFLHNHV